MTAFFLKIMTRYLRRGIYRSAPLHGVAVGFNLQVRNRGPCELPHGLTGKPIHWQFPWLGFPIKGEPVTFVSIRRLDLHIIPRYRRARERKTLFMSNWNGKHQMKSGVSPRNSGRAPRRTKQPTPKPNQQRFRRKTTKKHSRRPPYLPARIVGPLRAIAESIANRRDRALLLVLIDSELRPTELVGLSRGQIRVRFEKQKDKTLKALGTGCLARTSTEPGRKFMIGPEAVEALREYLNSDRVRGDHPALFTERPGERLAIHTFAPMLDSWIRQAKDQAD
jgi:integrase